MLRGIHSPAAVLGASLQEAAGADSDLCDTRDTAQERVPHHTAAP